MDWGGVNFLQSYPSTNRSTMPERYGEFRTQYGGGAEADHSCTGAITWYDAPGATGPGTNPLPASLFGSVNKVRTFVQNHASPATIFQRTNISIGMVVAGGLAPGTLIPTWTNYAQVSGDQTSWDAMVNLPAGDWVRTTYDPAADVAGILTDSDQVYDDTPALSGRSGDVLTAVDVVANLVKLSQTASGSATYVQTDRWVPAASATDNEWSHTNTAPIYGPDAGFTYTIKPLLYANPAVPAGTLRTVLIEDCLPVSVVPDPTTTSIRWNYQGDEDTPYTRQLSCAQGEFYLAWYLPNVDISQPLKMLASETSFTEITLGVRVLATAFSGERTNNARITVASTPSVNALATPSNVDQRTAKARIEIEAPDGIRIAKSTATPIIYIDPIGWPSSRYAVWNVIARNLNSGQELSNVDIIDLLPVSGINDSSFHGGGAFVDARILPNSTPEEGDMSNAQVLYTSATVTAANFDAMSDPANAAFNGASGSTTWCSANADGSYSVVSGTGACPSTAAAVTGVRVLRAGEFASGNALRLQIRTNAEHNIGGDPRVPTASDVMHNIAGMRVQGLDALVISDERVVFDARDVPPNTGTIGGNIWDDLNSNGIWDAGEPPLAGVVVNLLNPDGSPALNPAGSGQGDDQQGRPVHR